MNFHYVLIQLYGDPDDCSKTMEEINDKLKNKEFSVKDYSMGVLMNLICCTYKNSLFNIRMEWENFFCKKENTMEYCISIEQYDENKINVLTIAYINSCGVSEEYDEENYLSYDLCKNESINKNPQNFKKYFQIINNEHLLEMLKD